MKYVITYVVFVLLSTAQWFHRKFHKVEIDQFLYHLERSSENVIKADFPLINSAIKNCVLAPLVYALLFLVLVFMAERVLKKISLQFSLSATLYSPVAIVISMALGVIYFLNLNIQLANPFVENRDWVAHFYAEPQVLSAPDKKRNLVLIYAESMESSLESLYPNDHLFDSLSFKNHAPVSFGSFSQLTDTGWTIAGMTSSQCGIPLKPLGIFNGDSIGESTTKFMPNAKCLGDVLKEYGYKNVFIGGASSDYSGKNLFLETHGYGEIYGRSEFIKMNSQIALNAWGANDDELFKFAKEKFLKLKAENNPFNLTLLTLGMHFPDGFLSPSCPSRYGDYRDPILCTSFLIKNFVDFVTNYP
jgi:phosphoglycerol transferase